MMPKTAAPPRRPRTPAPPPPVALPPLGVDEPPRRFRMSRERYLAFEEAQIHTKFEWVDGEAIEMTGGTFEHAELGLAFGAELRNALRGRAFKVCSCDMSVHVPNGPDRYPDVSVAAVPPRFERHPRDRHLKLLNPVVLVEVLYESTSGTDTVDKRDEYLRIPTVSDYLIAARDEVRVVHHRRDGDRWRTSTLRGTGAVIALQGLGVELSLADVYEGVLPRGTPASGPD